MLRKIVKKINGAIDFLDTKPLRELGCEYLFSCGEIGNMEQLGLELIGYYETETGYWGMWLYQP